jgi:putative spermidine/putrescine transport system permease protein
VATAGGGGFSMSARTAVAPSLRSRLTVTAVVAALFAAPLVALVVRAFADAWRAPDVLPQQWGARGFDVAFSQGGAAAALATSLAVAGATTALALALAWPAARVLGERRLRHPGAIFRLLALPLLVPPYAVGTGLTEWFLRLGLTGSGTGLVLAHLALVLPYAVLLLLSGFTPEVRRVEEMARAAGLSRPQRLAWVTVPCLRPTLAATALVSFLVSWSQYGTSLAVAPARPTLPVIMLPYVGPDPQVASALALLFLAPAVLALVATTHAMRVRR